MASKIVKLKDNELSVFPITTTEAVYDPDGKKLSNRLKELDGVITSEGNEIAAINEALDNKAPLIHTHPVDNALSDTSTNPVQNKVVDEAIRIHKHTTSQITDFPESMPASDVYPWAKEETKPTYTATEVGAIPMSTKGIANGVASLDSTGKVPTAQLPSFVDDILEGTLATFPTVGESGKIYVDTDTNKTYRWSGTQYVVVSDTLALGETSATAYRGDRGKAAYNHSQAAHAPSNAQKNADITKSEIEAKLTGTISSHNHTVVNGHTVLSDVPENAKFTDTVYTLPIGTSTTLGGIKSGNDITIDANGTVSVKDNSHNHTKSNISDFEHTHVKSEITDFPALGSASAKNVPTTGNAASGEVVLGSDSRLTNARTPVEHTHEVSEITDFPTSLPASGGNADTVDGRHASDFAPINGVYDSWRVNHTYQGVASANITTIASEVIIKTMIPFTSNTCSPIIEISGYENITDQPIGLKVGFTVNNNAYSHYAASQVGSYKPTIYIGTYINEGIKCCAIVLVGNMMPALHISYSDIIDVLYNGWTIEGNVAGGTTSFLSNLTDLYEVEYKPTFSSHINGIIYNGIDDIELTPQNIDAAPANHNHDEAYEPKNSNIQKHINSAHAPSDAQKNSDITKEEIEDKLTGIIDSHEHTEVNGHTVLSDVPANAKFTDTTYVNATTTNSGLMSSTDKVKLNNIEANANNYSLPVADSSTLGGIKSGADITIDTNGNVSVKDNSHSHTKSNISDFPASMPASDVHDWAKQETKPIYTSDEVGAIDVSLKGRAGGVAELDNTGKVPSSQLPSYVDDVVEGTYATFPSVGEVGKIYVDTITNKTYRWSGSVYSNIGSDLALGETSATAYRGDRGKISYEHSQSDHAPSDAQKNSDITKTEIENKLTGVVSSHEHTEVNGHTVLSDVPENAVFTDTTYTNATTTKAGLMSSSDKVKVDSVESGAQKNSNITKEEIEAKLTGEIDSHTHDYLPSDGTAVAANKAYTNDSYITSSDDVSGHWTVTVPSITELYDGLTVNIRVNTTPSISYNTLNINGLGEKLLWFRNGIRLSNHFPKNSDITITYHTTGSTVTLDGVTYTGGWYAQYAYYNDQNRSVGYYYFAPVVGDNKINSHQLCYFDPDGKLQPMTLAYSTSATKPVNTIPIDIHKPILYIPSTANANTVMSLGNYYTQTDISVCNYCFNGTPASYSNVYLRGTMNSDGYFVLNTTTYTSWFIAVPYNIEVDLNDYLDTDSVYMLIGYKANGTNFALTIEHPMYTFNGTELIHQLYLNKGTVTADTFKGNATSASKLTISAGSSNQPVYFEDGKPVPTDYTIESSVPANAKFTDTTYGVATTANSGLMSATDKVKLNSVESGANKYTLPTATSSTLGGIKSGTDITVDTSGNVSVNDNSHKHTVDNITDFPSSLPASDVSAWAKAANKPTYTATEVGAIPSTFKGVANGIAELDSTGKVPAAQLPSYVDDIIEGTVSSFPTTGETGKIYVDTTTNKTYRWSGSGYIVVSETLALGETASSAYRGDRGAVAYTHSQTSHAPSNAQKNSDILKSEIESKLTGNITSHTHTLVNGHTVESDVPANAAFTDTTYSLVSTTSSGLMSSDDKTKLNSVSSGAQKNSDITKAEIEAKLTGEISSHTHDYLPSDGTAIAADKLSTTRNINSVAFDGTSDISIGTLESIEILENEDLNDYKTPGMYFCRFIDIAQTLNNTPTSYAFALLVERSGNTSHKQTLTTCNSPFNMYVRSYNATLNGWTGWARVYTTTDPPTSISGNAGTATKLTSSAGSATQPIYFSDGKPVATTYTLGKSVPSNAVFTDTTYDISTTEKDGLMSASDKTKLNTVESGANNYTLPTATENVLGGIKSGTDITIDASGNVSVNDNSHLHTKSNITDFPSSMPASDVYSWAKASTKPKYTADEVGALSSALKGVANGLAELDSNGKVPAAQLPSFVDDVIEATLATFPEVGESDKIYVDKDTNITYRWSGTTYVAIGSDLALGETSSSAYRGDRGAISYTHSQSAHAPVNAQKNSDITKAEIESKLTGSISTHSHTTVNGHTVLSDIPANAKFTDTTYGVATTSNNGLMSSTDKTKLDNIDDGAQKNSNITKEEIESKLTGEISTHTHDYLPTDGTATLATKLKTARAINGVSFDGTKNISIGTIVPIVIPAESDLDDYKTPGMYYCPTNSIVPTLANCPTEHAFSLLVEKHAGFKQTLTEYTPNIYKIFIRTFYNNTWYDWIRVYTTIDAPATVAGNAETASALTSSAGSLTQPIYFKDGKPAPTDYTVEKSVPSDAKFTDTTYNPATTSVSGLMSAADKTKLDTVESGANNYTLPIASSSTIGGVKSGTDITVDSSGNVSVNNNSHTHTKANISDFPTSMPASDVSAWAKASTKPTYTASEVGALSASLKGAVNGLAELDSSGKVPSSQLPSFVDDVIEATLSTFPAIGESGKIYVDTTTNKTYRWSGSSYVAISDTIALGETSSTAYRGDYGKLAYEHSQTTHAPNNAQKNSDITKSEIEAKLTGTIATHNHTTVNGHTVLSDVPASAKFTDTTYSNATSSASGLMSSTDKVKLDTVDSGAQKNSDITKSEIEAKLTGKISSHKHDTLTYTDLREDPTTPDDYNDEPFKFSGIKRYSAIGMNQSQSTLYSYLLGLRGWKNSSAGDAHELAFSDQGKIYHRTGSTDTWNTWKQLLEQGDTADSAKTAYANDSYTTSSDDTAGRWTVTIPGITELYDGLTINIKLDTSYNVTYNTLNVNGLGEKVIWYRYNTRLTSHFAKNAELTLTYRTLAGSYTYGGTTYTDGWIVKYNYDSNTNHVLSYHYYKAIVGDNPIYMYQMCYFDQNGRVQPLVLTSGTSSTKIANPTPIDFNNIFFFSASTNTIAAGTQMPNSSIRVVSDFYHQYTFNGLANVVSSVYLKGNINSDGYFVLDDTSYTSWYVQVPFVNTTELETYFDTDSVYILLCYYYNTVTCQLPLEHPMYTFDGTKLVRKVHIRDGSMTAGTFEGNLKGNAETASALTTSAGSATHPIYFDDGKPVATSYTLGKSVPSDAKFTDTTYSVATTTTSGLMAYADKTKLDNIESGANKYTLPVATSGTLGGVKSGTDVTIDTSGNISVNDNSHKHTKSNISDFPTSMPASDVSAWAKASSKPTYTATEVGAIASTLKGAANGVAELDSTGKIPSAQLPSFVDDVIEGTLSTFPATGETGKIYVDTSTNKTYRWSGTTYSVISDTIALGETSSTAYRGDRGKIAYDHSQVSHAPSTAQKNSDITKAEIEAKLTGSISSHTHDYLASSGTAVAATKLETARYINGVAFDGTNNIYINRLVPALVTANSNLDNYQNPGMYYCGPTATASTISNAPEPISFSLLVEKAGNASVKQTVTTCPNGSHKTYIRTYDASVFEWGEWARVYTTLDPPPTVEGNAVSASKLATARTISLTGSVTGSGLFDGSDNLSITTTTNHTHSYLPLAGGTLTGTLNTASNLYGDDYSNAGINLNNSNIAGANGLFFNDSNNNAYTGLNFYRSDTTVDTLKGKNGELLWTPNRTRDTSGTSYKVLTENNFNDNITGVDSWTIGNTIYNVASIYSLIGYPTQFLIKTRIPFVVSADMANIHISGYSYYNRTNIDLTVCFYIFGSADNPSFIHYSVINNGAWKPSVSLCSYLNGSTKYVAILLNSTLNNYCTSFSVSYQSMRGYMSQYGTGWTVICNNEDNTIDYIESGDVDNVKAVSYNSSFSAKINGVAFNGINDISLTPAHIGAASSSHTHSVATTSTAGFMSTPDKVKLDSIASNAQKNSDITKAEIEAKLTGTIASHNHTLVNGHTVLSDVPSDAKFTDTVYSLPVATSSVLGGVKSGTDITVDTSGNVSVVNNSHLHTKANISDFPSSMPASDVYSWAKASTKPSYTASEVGAISTDLKGSANGVAELDSTGKVPAAQLPSFVDDIVEGTLSTFPSAGEAGKIYVDTDTNKTYRWSGSTYIVVSETIALGETSSTAYRGDRGAIAYTHSQAAHAPSTAQKNSDITKSEIEAKLTGTITSHNHTVVNGHTVLSDVPANAKFTDTTYSTVTTSANGLMLATDKVKLNGISAGAQKNSEITKAEIESKLTGEISTHTHDYLASGGTAVAANKLSTARNINGVSFDGTSDIEIGTFTPTEIPFGSDLNDYMIPGFYNCRPNVTVESLSNCPTNLTFSLIIEKSGTLSRKQTLSTYKANNHKIYIREYDGDTQAWGTWERVYTTIDPPVNITGNAATATKLSVINVGSSKTPVYFEDGQPVPIDFKIEANVPADASFTDTTYTAATTSADGLMSSADKIKLNNIATGANNYTLPVATSSALGGVKSGTDITIDSSGNVSVNNNSHTHTKSNITDFPTSLPASDVYSWAKAANKPTYTYAEVGALSESLKGAANGIAELDENGKVPAAQLPSFVDDVLEATLATFPSIGEANKIYVDTETNKTYRWSGTSYIVISDTIALGETSSTAYRGDRGAAAYNHSLSAHAPSTAQKNSDITKAEIEAKLTGTVTSHNHTTVNGHTVLSDVPSGAKFTDTTYSVATTSTNGLMSSTDKTKLNGISTGAQKNSEITKAEIEDKLTGEITSHTHDYLASDGVSASAIKLSTARTINGVSFDGTSDISIGTLVPIEITANTDLNNYTNAGMYYCRRNIIAQSLLHCPVIYAFSLLVEHSALYKQTLTTYHAAHKTYIRTYDVDSATWTSWARVYTTIDPPTSVTGNAGTATKLTTSAGSVTQPVYFSDGKPVATTYTLGKSVPSNAVFTDTTYSAATTTTNGLMIASDKTKLDGIAIGANNYSLPVATSSTLGGIKSGTDITVDSSGNVSVVNNSHTHTKANITDFPSSMPASDVYSWAKASTKPTYTASEVGAIATTSKGVANGVASLDENGKVPSAQLPSFVDDVIEGTLSTFPTAGETSKIYVDTTTNKTYRWSGTAYVVVSETIALGETSATAYRGDRGKIAYDHSQVAHAPSTAQKNSDITKAEIEAKLTGAITSHTHSYLPLTGNAASATKLATARTIALTGSVTGSGIFDGTGNLSIATTTNHTHSYLPLSGGTLTGTLHTSSSLCADNYTTAGINMHNSDIVGLNSIFFEDTTSDTNYEGLNFYRNSTTVDTLRGYDGELFWTPNRTIGTSGTTYKVLTENNFNDNIKGTTGLWKIGNTAYNVAKTYVGRYDPTQIMIQTGIPFEYNTMVALNLEGYAYSQSMPIDLRINFYTYNSTFIYTGVVYGSVWKPIIKLCTYLVGTAKYVAIVLEKTANTSLNYAGFTVSYQHTNPTSSDYSTGWSIRHNGVDTTVELLTDTDVCTVEKKNLFTSTINGLTLTDGGSISLTAADIGAAAASHTHSSATTSTDGYMSASDKSKLDNIADGAQKNSTITKAEIEAKLTGTIDTHNHSSIGYEGDARDVQTTPNDYNSNLIFKGIKNNSTIGIDSTETYSYLLGLRGWSNNYGGNAHELAFSNDGSIYHRNGATDTWSTWKQLLEQGDNAASSTKSYTSDSYATGTDDVAGRWTVTIPEITELYDGLTIHIKLSKTYNATYNTLNVNGLGAKLVWYRYNSRLTSHVLLNAELTLTYRSAAGSYTYGDTTYTDGWILTYGYNSDNDYRFTYVYYRPYAGSNAIAGYKLCYHDADGRAQPFTITAGTGSTKVVNTAPIDLNNFIFYYDGSGQVSANTYFPGSTVKPQAQTTVCLSNFNSAISAYRKIYLRGTFNEDGLFVLDTSTYTSWYIQVPYSTTITLSNYFDTDHAYVLLGYSYSSVNYMQLLLEHPVVTFDGTKLVYCKNYGKGHITAANFNGNLNGNASTATALTSDAGSATQPVYFKDGKPTATTYTLGKSVPSNAVFTDTTYSVATTSTNGLMSTTDKSKLDGIASGANNYSLPVATSSSLGGVKSGTDITVDSSGNVSVVNNSHTHTKENITDFAHTHNVTEVEARSGTYNNNYINTIASGDIDVTRACRTAFLPADAIDIEYSRDDGVTWADQEVDYYNKRHLFAATRNGNVKIGSTGAVAVGNMTRITIKSLDRYVYVNSLYCYFNTQGHSTQIQIEKSTVGDPDNFTVISDYKPVAGWAGHNIYYFGYNTFGGSLTSNGYAFRFTFRITAVNTSSTYASIPPTVMDLRMYGHTAWSSSINMALNDHLYSWDTSQNAIFPAKVKGTSLTSTVATGTAPLTVESTTNVTNLNADLLDGYHASSFEPANENIQTHIASAHAPSTAQKNSDITKAEIEAKLTGAITTHSHTTVNGHTVLSNVPASAKFTDTTYSNATSSAAGLMSASDKTKLDTVSTNAQKNSDITKSEIEAKLTGSISSHNHHTTQTITLTASSWSNSSQTVTVTGVTSSNDIIVSAPISSQNDYISSGVVCTTQSTNSLTFTCMNTPTADIQVNVLILL